MGIFGSKMSALFTGETKGLKQERIIQDLTVFKNCYEHFIDFVKKDEFYIEPSMGTSAKAAGEYAERVRCSRASVRDRKNVDDVFKYIVETLVTDILNDFNYGTNTYRKKAGCNISPVLKQDFDNCIRILNKYSNSKYQLNRSNQVSNYTEFENAYNQAVNLIYCIEHSLDFEVNRANDIAAGIKRKK